MRERGDQGEMERKDSECKRDGGLEKASDRVEDGC